MARHPKQTRKHIAIALAVAALFLGAYAVGEYRTNRMVAYAEEHGCTWQFSYYVNEEPICR